MDAPGAFQSLWIELSTTVMNIEHAQNLTEQETMASATANSVITVLKRTLSRFELREVS